jgi:hypothetical protein
VIDPGGERRKSLSAALISPPLARLRAGLFRFRSLTMADYFTHFSCLLDVGTPENAASCIWR